MGSFPSQEQAVHPTLDGASEPEASPSNPTAIQQQPPAYPPSARSRRPSHTLTKKRARGRVLVLGLDGAGKTTVVAHLARAGDEDGRYVATSSLNGEQLADEPRSAREYPHASKTFQATLYKLERDTYVQLIDVPGRREDRRRWYTTGLGASSGDLSSGSYASSLASAGSLSSSTQPLPLLGVVFVIDASDRVRFPVVAQELARFQQLKEQKKALRKAPLFLLLNKTDVATAAAAASATEPTHARHHQQQQQSDQQRHAIDVAKRTAMRAARRELKQCIDHHVRLDQKRNPRAYSHTGHTTTTTSGFGHGVVPESSSAVSPAHVSSALRSVVAVAAEASAARTTGMMASILECCAHDRTSGSAIHAWLKDEIKKAL